MALELNDTDIIYYHMDTTWSLVLAQTYFAHPDCLVVQGWIHTFLSPNMDNQMATHYVESYQGVGYMPLGVPCEHILAIVDDSNTACSFIVYAYPAL